MTRLLWVLAVLFVMQLPACSSTPSYGSVPQSLSVRILPNTSKQFIYRVGLPPEVEARLDPRTRPGRPPGKSAYRKLQRRTEYVVAQTGYCRQGYIELDFRLSNQVQWIRGECREGASEQDMQTYGESAKVSLKQLDE